MDTYRLTDRLTSFFTGCFAYYLLPSLLTLTDCITMLAILVRLEADDTRTQLQLCCISMSAWKVGIVKETARLCRSMTLRADVVDAVAHRLHQRVEIRHPIKVLKDAARIP